jgi:DNA invertase Pin-like site-specific DNA recombinase
MTEKIREAHRRRAAAVYIRQSSPTQVEGNLESQRRQYGLADRARELGFRSVEVIDDDLGRSGSGSTDRPGFQKLVSIVCAGEVGAVFCIEASRLARNGRDWHHLIDLCGLVDCLVIDPDGVYDPRVPNDRLLLGLKGTMSEFELTLLRQRSFEALRSKAKRGELKFCLPVGFQWNDQDQIELEPDRRIQDAVHSVFRKFDELGSARQVLLWFRREDITLPVAEVSADARRGHVWKLPVYNTIHAFITNPVYAGAYAFGRTEARTRVVDGRARKTAGHDKPREQWTVLIEDHHPGYITWPQYERNQVILAENAHMKGRMGKKAARGGRALLAGLLRCRRCGRKLHISYGGIGGRVARYHCRGAHLNHGEDWCISFGSLRVDEAIAKLILGVVQPKAIEAATTAAELTVTKKRDQRRAVELELEQACYEADLAARRYDAVDPANRLVADELESRWEHALSRVEELRRRLAELPADSNASLPSVAELQSLASDLVAVWNSPSSDMRLKQRIVRVLIREIIADVDEETSEIVLVVHWDGGRHSEARVRKNKTGHHRRRTGEEAEGIIRRMAGRWGRRDRGDAESSEPSNRRGQHMERATCLHGSSSHEAAGV